MKTYKLKLRGITPLVYGKYVTEEKQPRESHDAFEKRTWELKSHFDDDGYYIPYLALKNSLSNAAKYLSKQIPGKGKSTYTKHFEAGIMVRGNLRLQDHSPVKPLWLHVPADGRRGGSTRVMRCFPLIQNWETEAEIIVLDDIITKDVLKEHLDVCGLLIGLLTFRPRNNGDKGQFELLELSEA